jgi:hypothetical protein
MSVAEKVGLGAQARPSGEANGAGPDARLRGGEGAGSRGREERRRVKPVAGKTRAARKGAPVTHNRGGMRWLRAPSRALASNNQGASTPR